MSAVSQNRHAAKLLVLSDENAMIYDTHRTTRALFALSGKKCRNRAAVIAVLTLASTTVQAAQPSGTVQRARADTLAALMRCRAINENQARLTCFDESVTAIDSAERAGTIVFLDQDQVRETNRRLFGFQITNPFTGRDDTAERVQVDEIETALQSAGISSEGKWIFRLEDSSEWRQIDSAPVRFRNREGEAVRVRRAALGSYLLTIGNSRAVRVRRQ